VGLDGSLLSGRRNKVLLVFIMPKKQKIFNVRRSCSLRNCNGGCGNSKCPYRVTRNRVNYFVPSVQAVVGDQYETVVDVCPPGVVDESPPEAPSAVPEDTPLDWAKDIPCRDVVVTLRHPQFRKDEIVKAAFDTDKKDAKIWSTFVKWIDNGCVGPCPDCGRVLTDPYQPCVCVRDLLVWSECANWGVVEIDDDC
jgi:hypothetical protein